MAENAVAVAPAAEPAMATQVPPPWSSLFSRAAPRNTHRRAATAVTVIGMVITLVGLLLIVGAWRDDRWIESRTGHATADVLSVAFDRTVVRFDTPDGAAHIPVDGVLYPQGLEAGQRVRVEYDLSQPDALVRVEGRNYALTFLPVGTILVVTWMVVAGAVWWLSRRGPQSPRRATRAG